MKFYFQRALIEKQVLRPSFAEKLYFHLKEDESEEDAEEEEMLLAVPSAS